MHWAASLIGKPYAAAGEPDDGPHAFTCWGLVRYVFRTRHGIAMPEVAVGDAGNEPALRRAAIVSGWRPVEGPPAADDIVLMRAVTGLRHVGLRVLANGHLGVLHALEGQGVKFSHDAEVDLMGYSDLEHWRRTCTA
jgi:cell wall-associated NlpC family hydrolase